MKFNFKVLLAFFGLILTSCLTFGQDPGGTIAPPDLTGGLSGLFATLVSLVTLVIFVASWINGKLHTNGTWKQIISWAVALAFSFLGWALHLGFMDGQVWYQVLISGFAAGLAANGIFDITLIQAFLKLFGLEKNKPK